MVWQAVERAAAEAVSVQLEGVGGAVGARLEGFKSRVLKGGGAAEQRARHLYATAWQPVPEADAAGDEAAVLALGAGRPLARSSDSVAPSDSVARASVAPALARALDRRAPSAC